MYIINILQFGIYPHRSKSATNVMGVTNHLLNGLMICSTRMESVPNTVIGTKNLWLNDW